MSLAEPTNINNSNLNYQERLSIDKDIFKNLRKSLSFLSPRDDTSDKLSSTENDPIFNKERYQIAICQDGRFAVTFDTGKNSFKNLKIYVMFIISLIIKLKKNELSFISFFLKKSKSSD
jgi:hypothetical protein